jgi:hypothetical protein
MRLFGKLRRSTDPGAADEPPEASADRAVDQRGGAVAAAPPVSTGPPPSPLPSEPTVTTPPAPDPGRYDPSHPCHAPVSGVDLVLFAQITHRLRGAPAVERGALLADHGHTPESWNAVSTVWVARLGQMPYLCATFDEASRLA